jgi:hypothetical protein
MTLDPSPAASTSPDPPRPLLGEVAVQPASSSAAPPKYAVALAHVEHDAETIRQLWRRNLPEVPPQRYDWLYRSGAAEAWLLRGPDGDAVGSAGLMRRRLKLFGELRAAGQAVDLNVDREHRFATPALLLQRAVTGAAKDGRVDAIYGFANAKSAALLRRAGYRPLGELQRWVKPLRMGPVLRARYGKGPLRNLGTSLALRLLGCAFPETYLYRRGPGRVEVVEQFDERFDTLWAAASPRFPIVGERTSDYLRWRFASSPDGPYRVLGLTDGRKSLTAYLVYERRGGYVCLSDFFAIGPGACRRLLAELLRRARREGAEAVATLWLGPARVAQTLRRFGFRRRSSGLTALLCPGPERAGVDRPRLFDPESWYLTAADLDVDAF